MTMSAPGNAVESALHGDEVICLHTPAPFVAIGDWYQDFSQVADAEVAGLNRAGLGTLLIDLLTPDEEHLFPEAGALSQVTDLAAGWFGRHFAERTPSRPRRERATFGLPEPDQRPCRCDRPRTTLGA